MSKLDASYGYYLALLMCNLCPKITTISQIIKLAFHTRFDHMDNFQVYKNKPKASDIEIVALSILMEQEGVHSEHQFYNTLKKNCAARLKSLPDRTNFNRRRRRLLPLIDETAIYLAEEMQQQEDLYIIDFTPLEICRLARFPKLKIMMAELDFRPKIAKNFIDNRNYAGYKLHMVTNDKGVIINHAITQANVHDVKLLKPLSKALPPHSQLIGDKGYIGENIQLEIFNSDMVQVYTACRRGQKPTPFPIDKHKQRVRKRIETCFSQLKDQFRMNQNYAKSFAGFQTRIISKIAAFTVSQYLNFRDGLPIGKVKYAL
jgi:hypothetical protein